jgi:hypothetical protein
VCNFFLAWLGKRAQKHDTIMRGLNWQTWLYLLRVQGRDEFKNEIWEI